MATSTMPALKGGLIASFKARAALANVQVTWGIPTSDPGMEWVWFGDMDGEQSPAAIGRLRRDEEYDLTIVISILRNDREIQTATERAFVLAAELEAQLRTDPTVGDAVRIAQIGGPFRLEERFDGDRSEARLIVTVHCEARI